MHDADPTNGLPSAAQLLYPVPGATNVPDGAGVLVYELPYISGSGVPISLQAGNGGVIATSPTQLPSPLPSPARTPFGSGDYPLFAVALPPLKAGTAYSVSAPQPAACVSSNGTIGTFSTR